MNEVIYRGLRLTSSNCRYYNIIEGNTDSIYEDTNNSTLRLIYRPGSTSKSLSITLGLDLVGDDIEMTPTYRPVKFRDVIVSLGGLRLRKLTSDSHILRIVIVGDSESRVAQDYNSTTIIVSKEDYNNPKFINFLFYSGNLLYLKPVGPKICEDYELKNYPKIIIKDSDITLNSKSQEIYSLRRKYDDYVIRSIDYQDQFILEIRKILKDYGIELVRINKEATLTNSNYITYQISQTPVKYHHPNYADIEDKILSQRVAVDFNFRCTDMQMFYDFKNKYNNVDLLCNFCEFKTMDKYGQSYTAAIKWGSITEDFNHLYQTDDNSNFSYQCQFRCELYFYEILDDRYEFLKEVVHSLKSEG